MITPADLPDDIDVLKAIVLRQQDQNTRLEKLVADFKRALFWVKSEKINPEQYELGLENIETAMAAIHAKNEAIDPPKPKPAPRKANGDHLPKQLPRVEEVIEPEDIQCSCGAERHIIGEVEEGQKTVRGTVSPTTLRATRHHSRAVPRDCDPSLQIRLPILRGGHCASPRQTAPDRGRHANRSHGGQRDCQQIR